MCYNKFTSDHMDASQHELKKITLLLKITIRQQKKFKIHDQ